MRTILILTLSVVVTQVSAQQVYEQVDSEGNASFSDQPTPGSQAVVIEPNVVDTEKPPPAAAPARQSAVPASKPETAQEAPVEIDEEPARHVVRPPAEDQPGGAASAGGAGSVSGVDSVGGARSVGSGPRPSPASRAR